MALRTYTPAVDLPDAVKNAIELAQNHVAALEGEQSRLAGITGELKTELVTLEHNISEAQDSLVKVQKQEKDTLSQIVVHQASEASLGAKVGALASEVKALLGEVEGLKEKKAILMSAITESTEHKAEIDNEYEKILEVVSKKQALISGLVEHIKQVSSML